MKKLLLSFAFALAGTLPSIAGNTANNNGTLNVTVNDYLTLSPNSSFSYGPVGFSDVMSMEEGWTSGNRTFSVAASRAWKFEVTSTDFQRVGGSTGAGPGVATVITPGALMSFKTTSSSPGVNTTGGSYVPASTSPINLANQAAGTLNSQFKFKVQIIPGLANQMSGTYNTQITQIASLN